MIQNITKAYVLLLSIFGFILVAGSLKTTLDPDETVYAPGRYTAIYNSSKKTFLQDKKNKTILDPTHLQANIFSYNNLTEKIQCH